MCLHVGLDSVRPAIVPIGMICRVAPAAATGSGVVLIRWLAQSVAGVRSAWAAQVEWRLVWAVAGLAGAGSEGPEGLGR